MSPAQRLAKLKRRHWVLAQGQGAASLDGLQQTESHDGTKPHGVRIGELAFTGVCQPRSPLIHLLMNGLTHLWRPSSGHLSKVPPDHISSYLIMEIKGHLVCWRGQPYSHPCGVSLAASAPRGLVGQPFRGTDSLWQRPDPGWDGEVSTLSLEMHWYYEAVREDCRPEGQSRAYLEVNRSIINGPVSQQIN